jgi:LysR family transcriptional regulator, benzoate and cis,cis-muconate-responsive activator of ben and cat genes
MDTRLLKYFLAIVDAGSISRAAERLHMTQPPLSAALSQLEKDLGVKLVTRTGRGVTPTPAGRALTLSATELLGSMEDIRARLKRIDSGLVGELRLAVVAPFLWGPLTELLRRTVTASPDVDVSVSSPAPLEILDLVRTGKADLGVIAVTETAALAEKFGEELHAARAGDYPLVAAVPPRFAGAPDPLDLTELSGEPWIMPRSTLGVPSLPEVIRDAWAEYGITPAREQTVESVATGLTLTSADLGVSLVPGSVRDVFHAGVLLRRPLQALPSLEFSVVWRKRDELPPAARRFLAMAAH